MISVCIASYNGERYIKDQISSILCQLSLDDEIILSDDGSNDKTLKIVSQFNDNRIKVVQGPKSGIVKNFENAIYNATGDFIFISDQDDVWLDNKVQEFLTCFESNNDVHLVVSDCTVVDSNLQTIRRSYFETRNSGSGLLKNLYKGGFHGCCMCFRKELLNHILPFPNNIPMHDWWIGLVAEAKGKTFFLDKTLLLYRRHGLNASSASERSTNSLFIQIKHRLNLIMNLIRRCL